MVITLSLIALAEIAAIYFFSKYEKRKEDHVHSYSSIIG